MRSFCLMLVLLAASAATALAQDTTPPADVTPSIITGRTTAVVSWTNSRDDGSTGCATYYEVRRSSSPIDNSNFSSATLIGSGEPGCAGSPGCAEDSGLNSCSPYYFAVRLRDEAGN